MDKRAIAKANLKRALYFGGGTAVLTSAVGLGVSIPVYNNIQNQLHKKISQLSDISSLMMQLADKLGLEPNENFRTELAGGYEVIYVGGTTQIYKVKGEEKVLMLNMNQDGSVGSAGNMQGLAAQKLLSVVDSASETLGHDAEAMGEILDGFKEEVEQESLNMESAVTGLSIEVLKARNILSVNPNDREAVRRAEDELAKDPKLLAAKAEAEQALAEQHKKEEELQNAKDDAERQQILQAQIDAKKAEIAKAAAEIKKAYIKYILANSKTFTEPQLISKTQDEIKVIYLQVQNEVAIARAQEAQTITTDKNLEAANNSDDSSIIKKIVSSPSALLNAIVRSFGYSSHTEIKYPSASTRVLLQKTASRVGVSLGAFERIVHVVGKELGVPANEYTNWRTNNTTIPKVKLTFNISVNTFNERVSELSKLVVLIGTKTFADGSRVNGYILAKSSNKFVTDFDKIKSLFSTNNANPSIDQLVKTVDMIIEGIRMDIYAQVQLKLFETINKVIDNQTINIITDPHGLEKMNALATVLRSNKLDRFTNSYLSEIMLKLGDKIILDGETVNFDPAKLVDAIKLVTEHDKKFFPSIVDSDLDSIYASTDIYKSTWMKKLLESTGLASSNYHREIQSLSEFYNNMNTSHGKYDDIFNYNDHDVSYNIITQKNSYAQQLIINTDKRVEDFTEYSDFDFSRLLAYTNNNFIDSTKVQFSTFIKTVQDFMDKKDEPTFNAQLSKLDGFSKSLVDYIFKTLARELMKNAQFNLFDTSHILDVINLIVEHDKKFFTGIETKAPSSIEGDASIYRHGWIWKVLNATKLNASSYPSVIQTLSSFEQNRQAHHGWYDLVFNYSNQEDAYKVIFQNNKYVQQILGNADSSVVDFYQKMNYTISDLLTLTNENFVNGNNITFANFIDNIKKLMKLNAHPKFDSLFNENKKIIISTLLNPKIDITAAFTDTLNIKEQIGHFDMNDDKNIELINVASGVSETLNKQSGITAQDTKTIQNKVYKILGSEKIPNKSDFEEVIKYTSTVFEVLSPQEAVAKLKEVLGDITKKTPQEITAILSAIRTFNLSVDEIAKVNPGKKITLEMIDHYVWHSQPINVQFGNDENKYNVSTGRDNMASGTVRLITGLASARKNDGTYETLTIGSINGVVMRVNKGPNGQAITEWLSNKPFPSQKKWQWQSNPFYDPSTDSMISLDLNLSSVGDKRILSIFSRQSNGTYKLYTIELQLASSISSNDIRTIVVDKQGFVYVITTHGQIYKTSKTTSEMIKASSTPVPTTTQVAPNVNLGNIWSADVFEFNGKEYLFVGDHSNGKVKYIDLSDPAGTWHEVDFSSATSTLHGVVGIAAASTKHLVFVINSEGEIFRLNFSDMSHPEVDLIINMKELKDQNNSTIAFDSLRGLFYNPTTSEMVVAGSNNGGKSIILFLPDKSELLNIMNRLIK